VFLALLLAGLFALWALSPLLIVSWIMRTVEVESGGVCSIEDVDVELLRGIVVIEGLRLTDRDPERSRTTLTIDRIEAYWGWRRLLFEGGGVDVRVTGLDLSVDLRTPWTGMIERAREGPPLATIRSIELDGGRLRASLHDRPTPVVELVDVEASLRATGFGVGNDETMTSHARLVGIDGGGGRLAIEASFAPLAPLLVWSLEVTADRIELSPLTPIIRRVFEMDVEHGELSVHARITQTLGRRRGRIDHSFHELRLYTPGHVEVRHPMAEALFGAMLSSADQPLLIDETPDLEEINREPLDLSAGLDDATYGDALERITQIIHRGYERRLNTLDGYDVTIQGLEVDYPDNRLSFRDIEVRRVGLKDGPAFFSLDELIVNIEQSITNREVDTYKAVTLIGPKLTFVAGTTPEQSQLNFDPDWVDKISAMPYPTDSLVIKGGRIEYRDMTGEAPISLAVVDLEVEGRSLARGVDPSAPEPLSVEVTANLVQGGRLTSKLRLRPRVVPPEGRFELQLSKTPLAPLNPVSRRYAQIDSSSGSVSVELAARLGDGVARSVITAKFDNVELLGEGEQHRRPLREFMVGRRLRALDGKPIEVEVPAATLDEFRDALPRTLIRAVLDASKTERPARRRRRERSEGDGRGDRERRGRHRRSRGHGEER